MKDSSSPKDNEMLISSSNQCLIKMGIALFVSLAVGWYLYKGFAESEIKNKVAAQAKLMGMASSDIETYYKTFGRFPDSSRGLLPEDLIQYRTIKSNDDNSGDFVPIDTFSNDDDFPKYTYRVFRREHQIKVSGNPLRYGNNTKVSYVISMGPDEDYDLSENLLFDSGYCEGRLTSATTLCLYDPSNGTFSSGDIVSWCCGKNMETKSP